MFFVPIAWMISTGTGDDGLEFCYRCAFMVDGIKHEVLIFWVDYVDIALPMHSPRRHLWHVTGSAILNQLEYFKTCRLDHGSESIEVHSR